MGKLTDDALHALARGQSALLSDPDRKQLRFNEIVETAKAFYNDPAAGVVELVNACDRSVASLYVPKRPMWDVLQKEHSWMAGTPLASQPSEPHVSSCRET